MKRLVARLFSRRASPLPKRGRAAVPAARPAVECLEGRASPALLLPPSLLVLGNITALTAVRGLAHNLASLIGALTPVAPTGPNLVPLVQNFSIDPSYTGSGAEVAEGDITPGAHKVLKFDFIARNVGNRDFVLGDPSALAARGLAVWSAAHGHYHISDFNTYELRSLSTGAVVVGHKQAFCVEDFERYSGSAAPQKYNCGYQGISPGWEDKYSSGIPGQYIAIDGLPDGVYALKATTNAKHIVPETTYADNSVTMYLRIRGNTVTEAPPPVVPIPRIATIVGLFGL